MKTSHLVNTSELTSALSNVDASSLNGKKIYGPISKEEYDAISVKDPDTIYLIDEEENASITSIPDYSTSDANKVLAVSSNGTSLAWVDAPSNIETLTSQQFTELCDNGSIIIDGKTILFNPNSYYIITDDNSGSLVLSDYQKVNDESLQTTDKTVPGSINELLTMVKNMENRIKTLENAQTPVSCTNISLSTSSLTFNTTDTQTITATLTPSNTTDVLSWSISPTGIATVDNGIVTPITNGSATITATCGEQTATCSVTVSLPVLQSISAVYTQGSTVVYPTTSLDSLKDNLVVTASYSDSSSKTITNYELSGVLTVGTSTVTVTYSGKTTTFDVTVTEEAVLQSISAVYTQGSTVVYPTTSLDSLKDNLVVTASYSDGNSTTVTDYSLSGTLTVGTSTITITYSGKTTTFDVTVTEEEIVEPSSDVMTNLTYQLNRTVTVDGVEEDSDGKVLSDFIPIYNNVYNIVYYDKGEGVIYEGMGIRIYDDTKNFVASESVNGNNVPQYKLFSTASNQNYIRLVMNETSENIINKRIVVNGLELCFNNTSEQIASKGDVLYRAGYITNSGSVFSNLTSYFTETLFTVESGKQITLNYDSSLVTSENNNMIDYIRINEYDENKEFITRQYTNTNLTNPTFTLNDSTKFISIGVTFKNTVNTTLYDFFNSFSIQ